MVDSLYGRTSEIESSEGQVWLGSAHGDVNVNGRQIFIGILMEGGRCLSYVGHSGLYNGEKLSAHGKDALAVHLVGIKSGILMGEGRKK